jgi:hypothetical protein
MKYVLIEHFGPSNSDDALRLAMQDIDESAVLG